MPERIQFLRFNGYPLPAGARLCTRPGRWGNPYAVRRATGGWQVVDTGDRVPAVVDAGDHTPGPACGPQILAAKRDACALAVRLFEAATGPGGVYEYDPATLARLLRDLGGRDLACSCPLLDDEGDPWPCHVRWLLALANPTTPNGDTTP